MTCVLEIEDLWFEDGGTRIVVDAVVADMVVVHPANPPRPTRVGACLVPRLLRPSRRGFDSRQR
jgi:hypothetical protein